MTTQDVIDAISDDDDGDSDVDDPDEPFMDGSDDDLSDLDREESDDDNMDCTSYLQSFLQYVPQLYQGPTSLRFAKFH